jgi:hypothetical protein
MFQKAGEAHLNSHLAISPQKLIYTLMPIKKAVSLLKRLFLLG